MGNLYLMKVSAIGFKGCIVAKHDRQPNVGNSPCIVALELCILLGIMAASKRVRKHDEGICLMCRNKYLSIDYFQYCLGNV